jgi:hypothetical protein
MLPFDTFAYAKELHRAGVPATQVEAQVNALTHAFKHCSEKYPTKQDLIQTESKLTAALLETDLRLRGAMNSLAAELRLIKWLGGVCVTGIATMLIRSL